MRIPSIHLNGSGRNALIKSFVDQYEAIDNAIGVFYNNSPHGRDYYVQDDGATQQALDEHKARILKLLDVRDEIATIIHALQNTEA